MTPRSMHSRSTARCISCRESLCCNLLYIFRRI